MMIVQQSKIGRSGQPMKYTNGRYQQTMGRPQTFLYCQSQMEHDPQKKKWQKTPYDDQRRNGILHTLYGNLDV